LRRSFREDGKVKNETLGNLSHLPEPLIDIIRRSLQGERFVPVGEAFEIVSSRPQGHVQAVRSAMKRLDIASLLGSKASRSRDRVLALVAARIVSPSSKLSIDCYFIHFVFPAAGDRSLIYLFDVSIYSVDQFFFREPLNKSSYRRRIKYKLLIFMDSRLRGNDEF
jgi:hypothetical protein